MINNTRLTSSLIPNAFFAALIILFCSCNNEESIRCCRNTYVENGEIGALNLTSPICDTNYLEVVNGVNLLYGDSAPWLHVDTWNEFVELVNDNQLGLEWVCDE